MSRGPDTTAPFPRLNPFAFPSETTLRFALLVVFALCGTTGLYGSLWGAVHRVGNHAASACVANVVDKILDPSFFAENSEDLARLAKTGILPRLSECSKLIRQEAIWQIVGILLTVAMTACLYFLIPTIIRRLGRLQPVTADEPPGLQQELQSLCRSIGHPKVPRLVWNPLGGGMPLVFGSNGRHYLALSGAFVGRLYGDKAAFRTIILHELAHIHCGDIDKTYLTAATCLAFLATNLGVLLVAPFAGLRWSDAPDLLIGSILWATLIILAGTSVMRAREYYADVQASAWEDTPAHIDRMLATLPEPAVGGWRNCIGFHPVPAERRKAVADPSILFPLGVWDAFAVGLAGWLILDSLNSLVAGLLPTDFRELILVFAMTKVLVPACIMVFAVGVVGIGVWRGAFAALIKGEDPAAGAGRLGLAMGASSLVLIAMTLLRARLEPADEMDIPFSWFLQFSKMDFAISLIVVISCYLVFQWIVEAVSAWLHVVLQARSPRPVLLLSVLAGLVLVVGTMASAYFVVTFYWLVGTRNVPEPTIMAALVIGAPIVFASLLAWAFPLAAGFWPCRSTQSDFPAWVFLDQTRIALALKEPWRPIGALVAALAMGLVFCIFLELTYFSSRGYFPVWASDRIGPAFSVLKVWAGENFGSGEGGIVLVAAALCQVLAAISAAAFARRFHAISGLLAASVAGGIIVGFDLLFFHEQLQQGMWPVVFGLPGPGSVVALPISIAVGSAKTAIGRRRGSHRLDDPGPSPDRPHPAWTILTRGLLAILCIAVLAGLAVRMRSVWLASQDLQALQATAEGGDSDAQSRLGRMYLFGQSVPQDMSQALFWTKKAAARGQAEAENTLGGMYMAGWGVPQDDASAVVWFRKSADQGNPNGENDLGFMYFAGRGVPQDDSLAVGWFRKSADQGNPSGENDLGFMYLSGRGVPQNDALAVDWFRKAADKGNANAQNFLGLAYNRARGAPHDDGAAVAWFRKAADQSLAAAESNLGMMYRLGLGTPRDDGAAITWLRKAADQGYAEAQYNVGQIYEQGGGVPQDESQAMAWYRKASDQGYALAVQRLHAMCEHAISPDCEQ
jgi:TPR repeat protein/Zn-dependent protease with chaperone function